MLAKDGISVLNRVAVLCPVGDVACRNVPWIAVPFDVIDATLPSLIWSMKYGLYGMRIRRTSVALCAAQ